MCVGIECLHASLHSVNLILVTPAYRRAMLDLARSSLRLFSVRSRVADDALADIGTPKSIVQTIA